MKSKIILFSCYLTIFYSLTQINAQVNESDSLALVAFYNSTNGDNWDDPWDLTQPVDTWHGIRFNSGNRDRVTMILVYGSGLSGVLPPEIGNLDQLEKLTVSSNEIGGEIPAEIGNLSNLTYLSMYQNNFTGSIPVEIGNLEALIYLSISNNQLTSIPAEIGNLENLEDLGLSNNLFTSIPTEIENLDNLELLSIGFNQLTDLPDELGNLEKLKYLYLMENQLTVIPDALGNLSNLVNLRMYSNNLEGEIPSTLGNLSNLNELDLQDNNLTGTIPQEFGNLQSLSFLYLSNNNLNGELPIEFYDMVDLEIVQIYNNQFEGEILDEIGNLINLGTLDLRNNSFSGTIPIEIGNLTEIYVLDLGNNNFSGSIPREFEYLTELGKIHLNDNNFSGDLPEGLSAFSRLYSVKIQNNNFTGIPDLSNSFLSYYYLGFDIRNNAIGFDDIIPNMAITDQGRSFYYSPQGRIDQEENLSIQKGDNITISVSELTEGINYQWKKENNNIEGANEATYSIDNIQTSDAGVYDCYMTQSDVPGLILKRNIITISVNELEEKYVFEDTNVDCETSLICYPISSESQIENAIGLDFTINYDPSKLTPSGNFTFNEDLVEDAEFISFTSNAESANGTLNISAYFNSNATVGATISGVGEVLCIEFEFTDEFTEGGTDLSIASVFESYVTGVGEFAGNIATLSANVLSEFTSSVKYWNEESNLTSINNSTVIFGMDEDCELNGFNTIADQNGNFIVDLSNDFINIYRDIAGDYDNEDEAIDVMEEINGADATLLEKILIKDASFLPSPYQMLAADVNMDGFISAGDLSQLNQRTILSIPEFKQAWNYNNDNTPNGNGISYDWIFIDKNYEHVNSSYTISETYPEDDGIGYSKFNLPIWSMCLEVPIQEDNSCTQSNNTHYNAILLGDIDGNWNSSGSSLLRSKGNGNELVMDLEVSIFEDEFIYIPLQMKTKNVLALDLALTFNTENLEFIDIESSNSVNVKENVKNNTLRVTSFSQTKYESGNQFVLKFKKLSNELNKEDFEGIRAYINGERGNAVIEGNFTLTGLEMNDISSDLRVYPNPSERVINIEFTGDLNGETEIKLFNMNGKELFVSRDLNNSISISDLPKGIYLLQIINGNNRGVRRVVKI